MCRAGRGRSGRGAGAGAGPGGAGRGGEAPSGGGGGGADPAGSRDRVRGSPEQSGLSPTAGAAGASPARSAGEPAVRLG